MTVVADESTGVGVDKRLSDARDIAVELVKGHRFNVFPDAGERNLIFLCVRSLYVRMELV